MSFWSSQTLEARLPNLIEPFDKKQIESASYELRLGEEVYISPLPDTPEGDQRKVILKKGETASIPPGQFAFLITSEKISIPIDAIAFISMKFKPKAKGLINVSGFHVDPGYKGRLIFAVYNAGPLNFQVEYGEQLFAIWFADLDAVDKRARTKEGFSSIPTDILNVPALVSSLPYLVKRLDEMEKKVEKYSVQQAFLLGLGIAIFTALVPFIPSLVKQFVDMYSRSNTNKTQPADTLPVPQPGSKSEEPRESKQLDQKIDSTK